MSRKKSVMMYRASGVFVVGYVAGTLGLVTVLIFAILMSAADGWSITFKFNLLGEAIVELAFLVAFLAIGLGSFWKIVRDLSV